MSRRPHSDASTRWQHFNENYKLLCLKANIGISQILIKASKKKKTTKKDVISQKTCKKTCKMTALCSFVLMLLQYPV